MPNNFFWQIASNVFENSHSYLTTNSDKSHQLFSLNVLYFPSELRSSWSAQLHRCCCSPWIYWDTTYSVWSDPIPIGMWGCPSKSVGSPSAWRGRHTIEQILIRQLFDIVVALAAARHPQVVFIQTCWCELWLSCASSAFGVGQDCGPLSLEASLRGI